MKVEAKVRGFICTTAHPAGCGEQVAQQIDYVLKKGKFDGPKRVLVLGCSTGYGLASRIVSAFGNEAATLGVAFERPASGNRTATAGWYNTASFEEKANKCGIYAKSVIGDAFSREIKNQVVNIIREDLGQVDLVIYSIAAPRRTDEQGNSYTSVLKPIGSAYQNKTIDLKNRAVTNISVEAATSDEIDQTIKVMGGEDWKLWMETLQSEELLSNDVITVAYTYIGPEVTHPLYRSGTIGKAKEDLEHSAFQITEALSPLNGKAYVSVNKALVTQASAAIPVVPLYITLLFKKMKEQGTHEGCIQQIYRLYREKLFHCPPIVDSENRPRVDDWEMDSVLQKEIAELWNEISTENLSKYADIDGYWKDFYNLFGFEVDGVNYEADQKIDVKIPSLSE